MTVDRPADGAAAPTRRRLAAAVLQSQWLIGVLLATATAALVFTLATGPGARHVEGRLFIPLLACLLVVVLRRWPLPVLAVVTVAAGLVSVRGVAPLPFGVLLGLALYFAALTLPRSRSIVLAGAVAAAEGATMVYAAFAVAYASIAAEAMGYFVPLAGAWFIADAVAARRRYQAGLAAQAERERAAEIREERLRIAREMHDVVAHALAVITVQAGVGRCLADQQPEQATATLGAIETIGRTAQDELRVVLGLMRDGEAAVAPLAPAPRLLDVKDLAETVRASGVFVELRMEETGQRLSPSLELTVYRVMQEALTNVVKHAPGARVAAELTVAAGKVRLDIRDDGGPGHDEPSNASGPGHGIVGMRERIGAFGGWLVAEPVAGGGFQVTAEVPAEGAAN